MKTLELLAPAKNADIAIEAIRHGADAVYIGAPAFGARAAAGNAVEDIARAVDFAHRFNARVYVTMNTILYDDELERARSLVCDLYRIGVDALIVQDMAYLTMDIPPIALHASTQCDIRTPAKAATLAAAGFSQIVLPRELSLEEIAAVREAVDVPLEVFVHGALCVSYSGDCQAGFRAMGRSANRGECPQMCRLPYNLVDDKGNVILKDKHLLSLKDMKRLDALADLIGAGATSFKIEGRLKDAAYVKNIVAAYSAALDSIVRASGGTMRRASDGRVSLGFTPSPDSTFNRSYTDYFLGGTSSAGRRRMACLDSPKWTGRSVGRVTVPYDSRKGFFEASLATELANGDGLGFFNGSGQFEGFRLNKVEGTRLYPASAVSVRKGTEIFRNYDKKFMDVLESASRPSAERTITVDFRLYAGAGGRVALEASDERGNCVTVYADCEVAEAQTPQTERRAEGLSRLGGTIYKAGKITDELEGRFLPSSVVAGLRRDAIELLDSAQKTCYRFDLRRRPELSADAFAGVPALTYHDNVANRLAKEFYKSHGASVGAEAVEVSNPDGGITVMTTRYCIRRELGACLRDRSAKKVLPEKLFLEGRGIRYRLCFDCARCGMRVIEDRE